MMSVLDRGGHLSELTFDRLRYDDALPASERAAIESHLTGCGECRAAMSMLAAEDAAFVVTPRAQVIPLKRPSAGRWIGAGVMAMAAAAAALIATSMPTNQVDLGLEHVDVMRVRGGPFDFEVFVHDGEGSRAVASGDTVFPGERMGFRVKARETGYLLVIGRDDAGQRYLCYPEGVIGDAVAVAITESQEPQTLPKAMRFDDVLGNEHITAIFCPAPFGADEVGENMQPPGCVSQAFTLKKQPRAP